MNARTGRRSLALLAAALLAACANVPAPTQSPTSAPPSASNLSLLFSSSLSTSTPTPPVTSDRHFLPVGPATVERDHIDRYACLSGLPLMCQCFSRLGSTCDCRC